MQALINQLDEQGFWSRFRVDENHRVEAVLFAHPDSLAYLQSYPELLLLDCTYKTNRFGMPLLDIIGIDGSNRSFCIAFAFLRGENTEDYLWALERLKTLYEISQIQLPSVILTDCAEPCMNAVDACFPDSVSLLCLWHTNKAILTNCRPAFFLPKLGLHQVENNNEEWQAFFGCWHSIIRSPDQVTFEQRVQELEDQYLSTHINEIAYLKSTWLNPFKQKLVKAWVNQHRHFGCHSCSKQKTYPIPAIT
jgi:MULE transposase domain